MKIEELVLFATVAFALVLLAVVAVCVPDAQCEQKEVQDVGGCSGAGLCAVRYTDGTFDTKVLPVKGWVYDVCKK